jgi:hypothetical protein
MLSTAVFWHLMALTVNNCHFGGRTCHWSYDNQRSATLKRRLRRETLLSISVLPLKLQAICCLQAAPADQLAPYAQTATTRSSQQCLPDLLTYERKRPPSLFSELHAGASPSYRGLHEPQNDTSARCRGYMDSLWDQFRPYADHHFVQDFASHTHQRFWEMYVGVTLLEAGHAIHAPKPGPDFGLTLSGRRTWIEAVAATRGAPGKPDSIPQRDFQEGMVRVGYVPQDKIVLRCTSAISAKFPTQYRRHVEMGIVRPEDCYIVAVNHAETYHYAEVGEPPYMLRAVLGLGSHFVTIDRSTGEVTGQGVQYRGSIPKITGASVETRIFLSPESAPVSAVIGSVTTIGTPIHLGQHQMGQDFRLIHNPSARNAVPAGLLVRGQEVRVSLHESQFEVSGRDLS